MLNLLTTTTKYCDGALTNAGTVNWIAGLVYIRNNNSSRHGHVVNQGLWQMQGNHTLDQWYATGLEIFSNTGTFQKSTGTGTGKFNVVLDNQAGTVEVLSGILSFNRSTSFTNGTVHVGINSSGNFGRIAVTGTATLSDSLAATLQNGFIPSTNNSFQVMTFSAKSGTFTNTSGLDVGFGRVFDPVYGATTLTLQTLETNVTTGTPIVLSDAQQEPGGFSFYFTGDPGSDYTVEFTPGLNPTNWSTLLVTNIPVSPAKVTDPNGSAPQRFYRVQPVGGTNLLNMPPSLGAISNVTLPEGTQLVFTNTAPDPDGDAVFFSLVSAPSGATLNLTNGVFSWTPTEAQGGTTNLIALRAFDDGAPQPECDPVLHGGCAQNQQSPGAAPIGHQLIGVGGTLWVTNTATDPDVPADGLTYALLSPPTGMSVNTDGVIHWSPTNTGSYSITLTVTDDGLPPVECHQHVCGQRDCQADASGRVDQLVDRRWHHGGPAGVE